MLLKMSAKCGGCTRHCISKKSTIQPLVSAVTSASPPPPPCTPHSNPPSCSTCFKNHHVCSRSKGVILILLWNIIVGISYGTIQVEALALALSTNKETKTPFKYSVYKILGAFGTIAVGQMLLFPIAGLLADIRYGRYKIVTFSLVKITLGSVFMLIVAIFYLISKDGPSSKIWLAIYYFSLVMCVILLLLGFSGFQSNAVQFGLDQLLEAPSEELSLFLHWYIWTGNLGEMIVRIIGSVVICNHLDALGIYPIFFAILTCGMLFFSCYKHKWFHCEPRTQNPYGLVYKVLRFVAKHKQPLQRSALTYTGDIIPSRMDFAKRIFGGPFTTEVVEDVKTFLRILLMLFFISPIFYYNISVTNVFPLYALNMGESEHHCDSYWVLLQSGNLAYMISFVATPLYIFFVLPHIQNWVPRILHRLWVGIFIMIMCVCVMTVLYATAMNRADHHDINTTCFFLAEYRDLNITSQMLEFPIIPLIIPNILAGIAQPIINITILEFISAQSPHTMKGLLLGAFYTVRGMFILIGCLVVFPFTAQVFEGTKKSPFLSCGFLYYLLNTLLGLVCLGLAMAGNWSYKHRDREEKPYDHTYVEEYYHRYNRRGNATTTSSEEIPPRPQIDSSIVTYGTMDGT